MASCCNRPNWHSSFSLAWPYGPSSLRRRHLCCRLDSCSKGGPPFRFSSAAQAREPPRPMHAAHATETKLRSQIDGLGPQWQRTPRARHKQRCLVAACHDHPFDYWSLLWVASNSRRTENESQDGDSQSTIGRQDGG